MTIYLHGNVIFLNQFIVHCFTLALCKGLKLNYLPDELHVFFLYYFIVNFFDQRTINSEEVMALTLPFNVEREESPTSLEDADNTVDDEQNPIERFPVSNDGWEMEVGSDVFEPKSCYQDDWS